MYEEWMGKATVRLQPDNITLQDEIKDFAERKSKILQDLGPFQLH